MANRFDAMTDEDLDHALGMYQSALIRRTAETQGWKRLAFDLIQAAGGTQRISMLIALRAHPKDTLEVYTDFASGDRVYRVRGPSDNGGE